MNNDFLRRVLSFFQQGEKKVSVKIEAFIEFDQGAIFGQIYAFSVSGFQMITDCDCNSVTNSSRDSLVNINGKYFPARIRVMGSRRLDGKFSKAIPHQDYNNILKNCHHTKDLLRS